MPSAAKCIRFEWESFGALHQMLSGLSEAEREATWEEIEGDLRRFEGPGSFLRISFRRRDQRAGALQPGRLSQSRRAAGALELSDQRVRDERDRKARQTDQAQELLYFSHKSPANAVVTVSQTVG